MATFTDMFNQAGQKLQQGFNNPWTQLGMQMLAQSGWQAGDPSFGQRFGQAGMGFMQQQAQMAEAQRQQAMQKLEMDEATAKSEERQRMLAVQDQLRTRAQQDPTFMADQPIARAVILAGGSPEQVKDMGSIAGQPKTPNQPFQYETTGPGGERTQMTWDPSQGKYVAGATYTPAAITNAQTAQKNAEIAEQRLQKDQATAEARAKAEQDKAAAATLKAQNEAKKAEREQQAAILKSTMDRKTLETGYKGAVTQIDETISLIKELEGSAGLDNLFGLRGQAPFTMPASDSAAAETRLNRLKGGLGLKELARLAEMGIVLTPVSNTDLAKVEQSAAALGSLQSAKDARTELTRIKTVLQNARDEAASRYSEYDKLYDLQSPQPQAQQGGAAAPKSQAEYDALPSGAVYIDPNTGRQARKR